MEIPLVNEDEVKKETVNEDIRKEIIEFLKIKGYKHMPSDENEDETNDFFIKEEQLIQMIINNEIPAEIFEQMEEANQ